MYNFVHGIKFGKLGVLIDFGTEEVFVEGEFFDKNDRWGRVGCRVENPFGTYFHFKHLGDAEDLMEWLLGNDDEVV